MNKIGFFNSSQMNSEWMLDQYEQDLVSVIIPTYNRAGMLADAIESVWMQTYRPIEIVIVDDDSTDETESCVKGWKKKLLKETNIYVHYFKQTKKDAGAARNLGLKKCNGEFIQFLDSDDILGSVKIERSVELLKQSNSLTTVYGPVRAFWKVDSIYWISKLIYFNRGTPLTEWIQGGFAFPVALLWRRLDILAMGPWDESLRADQDGEFGLRFLLMGGQMQPCTDAWSYYRSSTYTGATFVDNISSRKSDEAAWSRMRVTSNIVEILNREQKLNEELMKALFLRYTKFAKHYAIDGNFAVFLSCLNNMKKLWPEAHYRRTRIASYGFFLYATSILLPKKLVSIMRFTRHKLLSRGNWQSLAKLNTVKDLCHFDA